MDTHNSRIAGGPTTRGFAFAAPVLLTTLGIGWLLTVHHVIPGVQWAWVLLLAALGALILIGSGIDRISVVVGPALMAASLLSLARQTGRITIDTEVPVLTIIVGVLWTLAHLLPLTTPHWIIATPSDSIPLRADDLNGRT